MRVIQNSSWVKIFLAGFLELFHFNKILFIRISITYEYAYTLWIFFSDMQFSGHSEITQESKPYRFSSRAYFNF